MRLNIKNMNVNVTQTCVKCLKSIICISENKYKLCNQCKKNKFPKCIFCDWNIINNAELIQHLDSKEHKSKRECAINYMFS